MTVAILSNKPHDAGGTNAHPLKTATSEAASVGGEVKEIKISAKVGQPAHPEREFEGMRYPNRDRDGMKVFHFVPD